MKLINRFLFLFKTGRERVGAQAAQPKSNPPFPLLAHWPQLAPPGSNFREGVGVEAVLLLSPLVPTVTQPTGLLQTLWG